MKRNLISIIILVLLIVNTVLTAIMMFSVVSTNSKTAALVTDIASAISLDLNANKGNAQVNVPIADVVPYTISDLQILLKKETPAEGEEGEVDDKDHYAVLSVTLSMNSKHKDYKTYGEGMATREDLIRGQIIEVVQQYTLKEAQSHPEKIQSDILARVQQLFDSDFIFNVSLSNKLLQ